MAKIRPQPREERVAAELPVMLGSTTGVTCNVSATGIFFEIGAACAVGSCISFSVELETGGNRIRLNCQGDVVRTEAREAGLGVAVAIRESVMEVVQ